MKYSEDFAKRFWSNVKVTDDPFLCWEWSGNYIENGYGRFWNGSATIGAHRIAYELSHGEVGDGLLVRHKCDNRLCCRPDHLETGTITDNMHDRHERGRDARGEDNGMSKLTDASVLMIRDMYDNGYPIRSIAELYGVTEKNVTCIISGRTWSHLPGVASRRKRGCPPRLSDDQVRAIRARCSSGESAGDVAREFSVTQEHIRAVVSGKRRGSVV